MFSNPQRRVASHEKDKRFKYFHFITFPETCIQDYVVS